MHYNLFDVVIKICGKDNENYKRTQVLYVSNSYGHSP